MSTPPSNTKLRDDAVISLKATKVSYPTWVKTTYPDRTATEWGKAFALLAQITDISPTPPPPLPQPPVPTPPPAPAKPPQQSQLLVPRVTQDVNQLVNTPTPTITLACTTKNTFGFVVDDVLIGNYSSPNLSFLSPVAFPDGYHLITGKEVNGALVLTPVWFLVDTAVPPTPSAPKLASYSDSLPMGDNSTTFTSPALQGSGCVPGYQVLIYDGTRNVGGAVVDSGGNWTARPTPLAVGDHMMSVLQINSAGTYSLRSDPLKLTILAA